MPDPLYTFKSLRYGSLRYYVTIEQTGVFRTPDGEITLDAKVAEDIAKRMMDAAIEQLNQTRVRFRTGRLEEALQDPRAHYTKGNEIRMFRAAFLDEEVPYWRAIDRGSVKARVQGRIISGIFQDNPLEYAVPSFGDPFRREYSGKPGGKGQSLHRHEQTPTRRRVRRAANFARAILRDNGVPSRQRKVTGLIQHDIKAHKFVQAARRAFKKSDANKLARQYVQDFAKNPRRKR